jgi:hypothetical protein
VQIATKLAAYAVVLVALFVWGWTMGQWLGPTVTGNLPGTGDRPGTTQPPLVHSHTGAGP